MDDLKKIGVKELVAIIVLTIGLKLGDTTPNLLFRKTFSATWMVPIFGGLFMLVALVFLLKVFKKYPTDLVTVIKQIFGKYIGFFVIFILFVFALMVSATDSSNYIDIMNSMFFPQTPKAFLYLAFILGCYLIARGGATTIARTAWIVFPYISLALFLLLVLDMKNMHLLYIFPLFGNGINRTLEVSFFHQSIFSEVIFLSVLIPYLKKKDTYKKGTLLGLGISTFVMVVFFIIYLMTFDAYPLSDLLYPFQLLTRTVNLGRFLTNFDAYFFAFWIVGALVRFSIYIYIITLLFTGAFNFKDEKKYILPISTLMLLIGSIPSNVVKNTFNYREHIFLSWGSVMMFSLPFILWLVSLMRKKGSV